MSNQISAEQGSYLGQQLEQVKSELAQSSKDLIEIRQETFSHYPAVEAAKQKAEITLKNYTTARADAVRDKARRDSLFSALTLAPVFSNRLLLIIAWAVLIFAIPFFAKYTIGKFLGIVLSLGLYIVLVRKGMKKQGDLKSKAECGSILLFGQCRLSFMHFGSKESGDSKYPYKAITAPADEKDISGNWRVDDKFGKMYDSDFVVFHTPKEADKIFAILKIPNDGSEAHLVDINANTEAWDWKIYKQMSADLVPLFAQDISAINTFATSAADWVKSYEYIASLEQRLKTLTDVTENWQDVAIEEETLDRVLKLVDLFASGRKPSPKGILLYGPPGTGKTLIARKLAKHAECNFEAVNISDLKAGHIGQTAPKVKELWARCREKAPTLLFVDECESAFAKRGGTDNDSFGNELVQTFLSEWDGFNQASGKVLVIAATNRHDIIDNAIMSRFTASVEIGLPNDVARKKILENEFKQADIDLEVSSALTTETAGMSGRDIHTLIATLVAENINREIKPENLIEQVRKIRGKGSTQVKSLTWDDVVLPETTMMEFQNLGKELKNAEKLAKLGISTPKGILLYGPPGTGKTQIARVLASQSGLSFIAAATSDLKANFTGQSGSKVKQLFETARSQAPCIVFIDEIDIVAGARNGGNDSFTQEIVGQMLQELDGVATKEGQVFLLAASNHPENIDSALMSRLERKIEIGLPDQVARSQILISMLNSKPTDFEVSEVANQLAEKTQGLSGRDLNSLVTRATRRAVSRAIQSGDDLEHTRITEEDLLESIGTSFAENE
ncbi:AAA family ATPase [Acinetobacter wuhouensis]|uniref:AAA family ATPase n=1 Tax=Acinetobacter wuhouensis TaxID=1879050 RepID=A0A3G2T2L3_9GAMM|nr:AAA family ATPase [Acinetobacter wuhouensis]AYO54500.1 AAA family ATPase [Acinetobacter wuhouensis]